RGGQGGSGMGRAGVLVRGPETARGAVGCQAAPRPYRARLLRLRARRPPIAYRLRTATICWCVIVMAPAASSRANHLSQVLPVALCTASELMDVDFFAAMGVPQASLS